MTGEQRPSLSEAELQDLYDRAAETEGLLLRRFHATTPEQNSCSAIKLRGLQHVLSLYDLAASLHKAFTGEKENLGLWIPKGHIVEVLRACCDERYKKHDIEYIFYEHGGINGLLVLHLSTRRQSRLFPEIYGLPIHMIVKLAEQCGREEIGSRVLPAWIDGYNKFKAEFDPTQAVPRLYRWGKEKEARMSSPSIPRKRVQSTAFTESQTGSDMQIKSTEVNTQQNLPSFEEIPLRFDFEPRTQGLPLPPSLQVQQQPPTLGDTASHFSDTLSVMPSSGMAQTSPVSNSEIMKDDSWSWTAVGMGYYLPEL